MKDYKVTYGNKHAKILSLSDKQANHHLKLMAKSKNTYIKIFEVIKCKN